MKIAFDAQLFLKGNKTGIAWCADNIIKELAKVPEYDCQCDFFSLGRTKEQIENVKVYEKLGVKLNPCKWFHSFAYRMLWSVIPVPYWWFFGKDRDVTVFFNYIVPPGVRGKKIVMVYDMAYKVYPETVHIKTRKQLELHLEKSCKRADLIVTTSEFSRKEILKYLRIDSDKVVVMPCGVDLELYHPDYPQEKIRECREKYQIQKEYFLYLGTLEPRKNLINLIKAYEMLKKRENGEIPQLVLAGGKGWYYEGIFKTVEECGLQNDVIFTGYVPEKEVPLLMNGAMAFVFPSLYEGFGMPPLEAMACGTPVIVSNTASLPEVVGDTGILVDEKNIADISRSMETLSHDKILRRTLREKGLLHVKHFTWEMSGKTIEKFIEYVKKEDSSESDKRSLEN